MELKEAILSLFDAQTASSLIEFGKSLSRIEADVLMFMARKSLCLYDVLLQLGIPPAHQWVVSDRLLDMRLTQLRGKRVALVDDTLFVGTTLAKAKSVLEEKKVGATVTVHIFAADKDEWDRRLIVPDHVTLLLESTQMMTVCAAVVNALALSPRPYLVDFPLSQPVRVTAAEMQGVLSPVEWSSHRISTELQDRNGVGVYSFFPCSSVFSELAACLGRSSSCVDIAKVRAFARKDGNCYHVQFVPLVTLKALARSDVRALASALLEQVLSQPGRDRVLDCVCTPRAQQRLVQYILSAMLGQRFGRSISAALGAKVEIRYDGEETDRHYGPWLHQEMAEIEAAAFPALWPGKMGREPLPLAVAPSSLPGIVRDWSVVPLTTKPGKSLARAKDSRALFADFANIFLNLNKTFEKPARDEVRMWGKAVLDAPRELVPNQDRLEKGIPWASIVDYLAQRYRIPRDGEGALLGREANNMLSLVLDLCNDMGIAVPITCEVEGVVFRAYRYGEDVRFADAELSLAFQAVKGLLEATGQQAIQKLRLEKLLVLLVKIGAGMGFLQPLFADAPVQDRAGIGFALRGPVVVHRPSLQDIGDPPTWLSRYLVERRVLGQAEGRDKGQYILGEDPGGSSARVTAPEEAKMLGTVLGLLLSPFGHVKAPLDDQTLTILATCWPPRHAAAALLKELTIFRRWYFKGAKRALEHLDWCDSEAIRECLDHVGRGVGHEAIHSVLPKFRGYRKGEYKRVFEKCMLFLERTRHDKAAATQWRSYWKTMTGLHAQGEQQAFDPPIDHAASVSWSLVACMSLLEVALTTPDNSRPRHNLRSAFVKFRKYSASMKDAGLEPPQLVTDLTRKLADIEASAETDVDLRQAAFLCALKGLTSQLPVILGLVETLTPLVADYGRLVGRRDYRYMLWYDIKDSTGSSAGASGQDVERHRQEVSAYERLANSRLQHLESSARADGGEVYCWHGNAFSMNDEKHVFFAGERALKHIAEVLGILVEGTQAWPRVRVRTYIVPCGFAGSRVYRQEKDSETKGQRFFEHWSRLKRKASRCENRCDPDRSFLLVAGKDLIGRFMVPPRVTWDNCRDGSITTEIELLTMSTTVRYGEIRPSVPEHEPQRLDLFGHEASLN